MPTAEQDELQRLRCEVDAMWIALCALGAMTGHDGHTIGLVLEKAAEQMPPEHGLHLNTLADTFRAGFDRAVALRAGLGGRDVHD